MWWQSMQTLISPTTASRMIWLSSHRDLLRNQWNPWAPVSLPQLGVSPLISSLQHHQIIRLLMHSCLAKTTLVLISVLEARNYKNSKQQDTKPKLKIKMIQSLWACLWRDRRSKKCRKTLKINVTPMGKCLLIHEEFLQTPLFYDVLSKARIKYCKLMLRKSK